MKHEFWVIDTNILLSALLNQHSLPGTVLKRARTEGTLLISPEIASEYFNVFSRPKFEKYVSLETRIEFIENIISNSFPIEIKEKINVCRDPKDNKFLELAVTAGASCIISGDNDLIVLILFRVFLFCLARIFCKDGKAAGLASKLNSPTPFFLL